jgi:hypothetical protein
MAATPGAWRVCVKPRANYRYVILSLSRSILSSIFRSISHPSNPYAVAAARGGFSCTQRPCELIDMQGEGGARAGRKAKKNAFLRPRRESRSSAFRCHRMPLHSAMKRTSLRLPPPLFHFETGLPPSQVSLSLRETPLPYPNHGLFPSETARRMADDKRRVVIIAGNYLY